TGDPSSIDRNSRVGVVAGIADVNGAAVGADNEVRSQRSGFRLKDHHVGSNGDLHSREPEGHRSSEKDCRAAPFHSIRFQISWRVGSRLGMDETIFMAKFPQQMVGQSCCFALSSPPSRIGGAAAPPYQVRDG